MGGIFSQDIAKNSKNSCPISFCAYVNIMLFRPISLHEANALIPLIKERLERLHIYVMEMNPDDVSADLYLDDDSLETIKVINEEIVLSDQELELAEDRARVHEFVQQEVLQLQRFGAYVREIYPGIVDFFSVRAGQLVRLTWHAEEDAISHWQPFDETGFHEAYRISDQDLFGRKVIQ